MADSRIKKVTIEKDNLPGVNIDNQYLVRFRVVSEDKNRFSHWSPVYKVDGTPAETVSGQVSVSGGFIIAVWSDEANFPKYDIFVKFDDGEYFYHGTSTTHTYSFINTGNSTVKVAIQISGYQKVRNDNLLIYESEDIPLV